MVANMALPAKHPQHPAARGDASDHHRHAWLVKADRVCIAADRGHGMISSPDESSNSWETRVFAEDASSLAAGIWPPRAYPCSFCHREFRSAQALGGHMNVHRRDRARMRHSISPPPAPFCATSHSISLQPPPATHASRHSYSSHMGPNPSTSPEFYPNKILSKPNVLPATALTFQPQSSTASLAAGYPSDMAVSFPLRLHLLASEAASSLMLPAEKSSDQLSLLSASPFEMRNGSHSSIAAGIRNSNAIDISSWSVPSTSSASSPSIILNCAVTSSSMAAAIPRKRARHDVPTAQLDNKSPTKKSNLTNNSDDQSYEDVGLGKCQKEYAKTHTLASKETLNMFDIRVDENIGTQQHAWAKACSKYIDLELRLGQRPPINK